MAHDVMTLTATIAATREKVATLQAELTTLERALAILQRQRPRAPRPTSGAPRPPVTVLEATRAVLREVGTPLSTTQVRARLAARGLSSTRATIGKALYRAVKAKQLTLVKPGLFALPGRGATTTPGGAPSASPRPRPARRAAS